jgi:rfaE bifunctional protein kinase chain/domain
MTKHKAPALDKVRILVVGDVMLDRYWFGDVSRISPEAPVPVVRIQKREARLGGAANVARNAAALGAHAGLLGIVGADEAGSEVENLLEGGGIHSYLKRDEAISTIIKLRVIGRQQQMVRIDFEEPPSDTVLRNKLVQYKTLLPDYDVIVLSDYNKGSLVNVADMIATARAEGKIVMVDPKGDDFTPYTGATVLTPNKSELKRIVGSWNSEEQLTAKAQNLRAELKLDALLLTRSEEGMTLYTADDRFHIPADAREVFDVSGAGDTVIATMAAMLGAGVSWNEAVQTANRAGGIVVGKLGTATVTREELFGA